MLLGRQKQKFLVWPSASEFQTNRDCCVEVTLPNIEMSADHKVSYAINEAFRLGGSTGLDEDNWRFVEDSNISRIIGLVDDSRAAVGEELLDDLFGTNSVFKTSKDLSDVYGAITRDRKLILYMRWRSSTIWARLLTTLANDIILVTDPNKKPWFTDEFDYKNLNLYRSLPPKRIIEVSSIDENAGSTVFEDVALNELAAIKDLKKDRLSFSTNVEAVTTHSTIIPLSRRWAKIRRNRLDELYSL